MSQREVLFTIWGWWGEDGRKELGGTFFVQTRLTEKTLNVHQRKTSEDNMKISESFEKSAIFPYFWFFCRVPCLDLGKLGSSDDEVTIYCLKKQPCI